jgi:hypothetical protein
MPIERSLEIECRLTDVLRLICAGRFSTPMLAEKVSVWIPPFSRCLTALRVRGYDIRVERRGVVWAYQLSANRPKGKVSNRKGPSRRNTRAS